MADFPIMANPEFKETMVQLATTDRGAPETFNSRYQTLLDNDNYLKAQAEKIKGVKLATVKATAWSAAAPYIQTVSVAGITAADVPFVSPYIPSGITAEEEREIRKAVSYVSYVDTGAGNIKVTCTENKPITDFTVVIKGA